MSLVGTARIVCEAGSIYQSGVRPSDRLSRLSTTAAACGGLLLSAWRAGDIGRLLPGAGRAVVPQQQGAAAANAGSVTLTADVGS